MSYGRLCEGCGLLPDICPGQVKCRYRVTAGQLADAQARIADLEDELSIAIADQNKAAAVVDRERASIAELRECLRRAFDIINGMFDVYANARGYKAKRDALLEAAARIEERSK
jgi:hypothetical protein